MYLEKKIGCRDCPISADQIWHNTGHAFTSI